CKAKYPAMTESKSLNIAGHSLGGALTQMLALSICDDNNEANINEVYTFNSPGAKNLKPHIALDSKQIYEVIKDSKNLIANERVA
ncbi:lipase family protein, partial [Helicobacter bilis]